MPPQLKKCHLDRLGRVVRPRSGRKTRRLWPQTADFISEDVPSPDSLRVDADRRLGHVRSRELRADGPPCDAEGDDIRLCYSSSTGSQSSVGRWKNNSSKSSSTGQNCELMGRPVMQKEITYVCYSSSMLVLSDDLHPMASSRELPPRQLETSETAWINWTTSASSTGCLDHVPSLMTYNEPATPFGKN